MSDLDRLFYWRGITPDFYNYKGELTPIPLDRRVHILAAMGVDSLKRSATMRMTVHVTLVVNWPLASSAMAITT